MCSVFQVVCINTQNLIKQSHSRRTAHPQAIPITAIKIVIGNENIRSVAKANKKHAITARIAVSNTPTLSRSLMSLSSFFNLRGYFAPRIVYTF